MIFIPLGELAIMIGIKRQNQNKTLIFKVISFTLVITP